MNKKSTKKALLMSALSLLLCCSMLIGTTFAWFTDEVTSGVNQIVAGNLDVELEYAKVVDGNVTGWESVAGKTDIFDPNALWEPGRVEVVYLKVSNLGTLALKYQLGVNVYSETPSISVETNEEFKLSDFLVFKVVEIEENQVGSYTRENAVNDQDARGLKDYNGQTTKLEVGGTDYVALIVYMPESVGNEANYKKGAPVPTIELGVNLFATQVEAEDDSYGDDYDENAWHDAFQVQSAEDLQTAINAGKTEIMLTADIKASEAIVIPEGKTIALNLAGHTVSGNIAKDNGAVLVNNGTLTLVGGEVDSTAANGAAAIDNNGTMTLKGVKITGAPITADGYPEYAIQTSGTLMIEEGTSVSSDRGAISIDGDGSTTINGGVFTANDINESLTSHVVDLDNDIPGEHILTINGGTFQHLYEQTSGGVVICNRTTNTVYVNGGNFSGGNYYGNDNLSDYGYGGTFSVKGGTFDAKPAAKYIAADYVAVDNGDGTYTVLPELEDENATLSAVAGYSHLYTDGTNYYVYDAAGLISMNKFWAANHYGNNMWGRSYNVMADIDATGYTWNEVYVIVGSNENNGFVFDGHGNTITGLTINGSLFSGTPNGLNKPENPGYVQDITFDGVKVVGNHFTGVLWSNVCNELVVKNVSVINSEITGKCNVAALVGGTVIDGAPDASVSFINCVVKNNVITAEGKDGQDPNGANTYVSRVYGNTTVTFENCVSEGNTITNSNGLVGGGIYGYTVWAGSGFAGTGTCDTFTNWDGLIVAGDADALKAVLAEGGKITLTADIVTTETLEISKDTTIDLAGNDIIVDALVDGDSNNPLFYVENGCKLVINDTTNSSSVSYPGMVYELGHQASLEINGGTHKSTTKPVIDMDRIVEIDGDWVTPSGMNVVINGGWIESGATAIYLTKGCNLTINDGTILSTGNGGSCVSVAAGATATINGGKLERNSVSGQILTVGGEVIMNDGLLVANPTDFVINAIYMNANGSKFTMNGGTIKFCVAKGTLVNRYVFYSSSYTGTVAIDGGTVYYVQDRLTQAGNKLTVTIDAGANMVETPANNGYPSESITAD